MNQTQYYRMELEDFRYPRTYAKIRSYYGTMEDFQGLIARLSEHPGTAIRFADTIDALESYPLDASVEHWTAGHRSRLLTPVEDVCRYDTILQNQAWEYRTVEGAVYRLRAEEIRVSQLLVCAEGVLKRCLRASITGLQTCVPGMGWYYPDVSIRGFPGMVTWQENVHTVHLFVEQCTHPLEERDLAMADITDVSKIDLAAAVGDILGET